MVSRGMSMVGAVEFEDTQAISVWRLGGCFSWSLRICSSEAEFTAEPSLRRTSIASAIRPWETSFSTRRAFLVIEEGDGA